MVAQQEKKEEQLKIMKQVFVGMLDTIAKSSKAMGWREELDQTMKLLDVLQDSIPETETKEFESISAGIRKAKEELIKSKEQNNALLAQMEMAMNGVGACLIASGGHIEELSGEYYKWLREMESDIASSKPIPTEEYESPEERKNRLREVQEKAMKEVREKIRQRDEASRKEDKVKTQKPKGNVGGTASGPVSEEAAFAKQMGLKMSTTTHLNELLALADKLDEAGEEEKANQIDELVAKMAPSANTPHHKNLEEILSELRERPDLAKLVCNYTYYGEFPPEETPEELYRDYERISDEIDLFVNGYIVEDSDPPADYDQKEAEKKDKKLLEELYKIVPPKEPINYAIDQVASAQSFSVFEKLASIADTLDSVGAIEEASLIDDFIEKNAAKGKEKEQDPYDTKQHHSEQIREPKREKEHKDRDGRKEHHIKTYQETGASALSTRHCPEHIGVSLSRIGEGVYQCALDGQVYNWETGWTDYDGVKHPGGSVAAQTPSTSEHAIPHRIFDSREKIL